VVTDRDATIRKAEALRAQGKVAAAIDEYLRLLASYPNDWNALNALGDLHATIGDVRRAVECFARVADHLQEEGFLSRAAASYRKILKSRPADDHALSQLAAIATRQGLVTDAKGYLERLLVVRRTYQDEGGAAECLVRLAALEAPSPEPHGPAMPVPTPPQVVPEASDTLDAEFEAALAEVHERTHALLQQSTDRAQVESQELDSVFRDLREAAEQELRERGESRVARLYAFATAREQEGDRACARILFEEIAATTADYRDVRERLAHLALDRGGDRAS
jgi:tetratricopeptide (TPR) repeat protein